MQSITLADLSLGLIPVMITVGFLLHWSLSVKTALLAILRMLIQLLLIGYALNYIFSNDEPLIIVLILCVMLFAASWISLNSVTQPSRSLFTYSLIAISVGGVFTLLITTQGVLHATPWYSPQVIIPIAGMIFSNAMTSISLAAERFYSEYEHQKNYIACRNIAYQTAMIPVLNALLAVGLVSLPGMMTGQILSGVSPLIAARYQIMVMLMILGSCGISTAIFLLLLKKEMKQVTDR
jgi:UDP-glucose/iron transport system permease protein